MHKADIIRNSYKVHIFSILEINVAIMVACMPACFSLLRYAFPRLRSRISSVRYLLFGSGPGDISSKPMRDITSPEGRYKGAAKTSSHRFWRLREPSNQAGPPQITSATQQSTTILTSGDFAFFGHSAPQALEKGESLT